MFMANAGGAWDNAKKVVEVDLKEKGTPLHAATVVGDTVGDPYKDTSSVALNPIIKFTTLFGLLAVEIAVSAREKALYIGVGSLLSWSGLCGSFLLRNAHQPELPCRKLQQRIREKIFLVTQVRELI